MFLQLNHLITDTSWLDLLRRSASWLLSRRPVCRGMRLWYGGMGSILTLHRVVSNAQETLIEQNLDLEVTEQALKDLIERFEGNGYEFISIEELYQRLIHQKTKHRRSIVLTFDDGYKDNLTLAYPILKRKKIPFCLYVTTDFPNAKARLWWYALEGLILSQKQINFDFNGGSYLWKLNTPKERNTAFNEIKCLLLANSSHQEEIFSKLGLKTDIFFQLSQKLCLSWDEIKKLAEDPLVTIGAHTTTHRRLSALTEAELQFEIQNSKSELEKKLGINIIHFSYPFGDRDSCGPREFKAVEAAGFKTAVTSREGNIQYRHKENNYTLPRFLVGGGRFFLPNKLELNMSGYRLLRAHQFNRLVCD